MSISEFYIQNNLAIKKIKEYCQSQRGQLKMPSKEKKMLKRKFIICKRTHNRNTWIDQGFSTVSHTAFCRLPNHFIFLSFFILWLFIFHLILAPISFGSCALAVHTNRPQSCDTHEAHARSLARARAYINIHIRARALLKQ